MSTTIPEINMKITYKLTELIEAAKKNCGIYNVVIEDNDDVVGVINSLLGAVHSKFIQTDMTEANIIGEDVTVKLYAGTETSSAGHGLMSSNKAGWKLLIVKKFTGEVKKLQEIIASK